MEPTSASPPDKTLDWALERIIMDKRIKPSTMYACITDIVESGRPFPDSLKAKFLLASLARTKDKVVTREISSSLELLKELFTDSQEEDIVNNRATLVPPTELLLQVKTELVIKIYRDGDDPDTMPPVIEEVFGKDTDPELVQRREELRHAAVNDNNSVLTAFDESLKEGKAPYEGALRYARKTYRALGNTSILQIISDDINSGRYQPGVGIGVGVPARQTFQSTTDALRRAARQLQVAGGPDPLPAAATMAANVANAAIAYAAPAAPATVTAAEAEEDGAGDGSPMPLSIAADALLAVGNATRQTEPLPPLARQPPTQAAVQQHLPHISALFANRPAYQPPPPQGLPARPFAPSPNRFPPSATPTPGPTPVRGQPPGALPRPLAVASDIPKQRRANRPWTDSETECLIEGVAMYRPGNWARILRHFQPVFAQAERNQVDLKDKWKNLLKSRNNRYHLVAVEVRDAYEGAVTATRGVPASEPHPQSAPSEPARLVGGGYLPEEEGAPIVTQPEEEEEQEETEEQEQEHEEPEAQAMEQEARRSRRLRPASKDAKEKRNSAPRARAAKRKKHG